MSPIKVGIIGYGFAAKSFHIPFITAIPDYEVVAILQRTKAPKDLACAPKGSHCLVDYPKIQHHTSADSFFAAPEIDLVVVASRIDTHAFFAEKALEAGKHVIVDKPFARSSEEADKVIRLAERKALLVTCFQNRRWDGDFLTLRELIKKDALGIIKEAEIHYDFESPGWLSQIKGEKYKPGAGMAFDLGTHNIDQALVLYGCPKSVTAFLRAQRGIDSEVEDSFTIILQYEGSQKDLLVTIKTCVTTPMAQQLKFFVRGTKGSFLKFQQRSTCSQEEHIETGLKPLDPDFGKEPESLHGLLTTYLEFDSSVQTLDRATQMYSGKYPTLAGRWMGLYENVANAIRGKEELAVKATQSRDVLRVIELARESQEKGETIAWS